MFDKSLLFLSTALLALRAAAAPTVTISYATVVGSTANGVDTFAGIPYAQPPVGQLRLRPPQSIKSNLGTVTATGTPTQCPQFLSIMPTAGLVNAGVNTSVIGQLEQNLVYAGYSAANGPTGENCLNLNVQRPSTATKTSKLPVAIWIYGGAFEIGSTQANDGGNLIRTSVSQGKSIIFVQMNYRLSGYGFMPGKEVLNSGNGNIGLLDQRMAIQWVADNIAAFGGDPTKVTLIGESAGAISVFDQLMLYRGNSTYNGSPLFRAAIMDSGSIVPADPLDCPKGQATYNAVVSAAGCSSAADTLACLRSVDFTTFNNAVNSVPGAFSYDSVALQYLPRPDGVVLAESPEVAARNGDYASVPFILGDQQDEGTIFSLTQTNLTNNAAVLQYLSTIFFQDATQAQIQGLLSTYPDDLGFSGSPFNTGYANNLYPQYKRLAAILGDLTFTLSRRLFLNYANSAKPTVPFYSYLATYGYGTPLLGTYHSSDVANLFGEPGSSPSVSSFIQAYYLSFINTLDPNSGTTTPLSTRAFQPWPRWSAAQQLLQFEALDVTTTPDNFRQSSYNYIANNVQYLHI